MSMVNGGQGSEGFMARESGFSLIEVLIAMAIDGDWWISPDSRAIQYLIFPKRVIVSAVNNETNCGSEFAS